MSDDLHSPAAMRGRAQLHSGYRARRPGVSRGFKTLLVAAGLGTVLLAGVAGWTLTGSRSTVVPVIEADSRPVRVKPENAGGLQVAGADEQVMGGGGSKLQGMAPTAEAPAAQALRAQMPPPTVTSPTLTSQAAAPQAATPLAEMPEAQTTQAQTTQAQTTQAVPAPPAVIPTPAAPPPVAPAPAATVRPPAAQPGGTFVQLAAVDSEGAAQTEWQRLARRMPDLLGDRRPVVLRSDRDGRAVWRIRTGGFADIADATAFCARVRAKGAACSIANF